MRALGLNVVVRFAEGDMGGDTLRTWHNRFAGTGTLQTCKGKEEFKVTTAGAQEVLTGEVLNTALCTIAYLEAEFVYCYVGVVVAFTTLIGRTETALTERLHKTTLSTLRWTLAVHSLK